MELWIATLDELLVRPFVSDDRGRSEPHHVDLRESRFFYDWDTADGDFDRALAAFNADRARLAQALSRRYGASERKSIRRYFFDGDASRDEPGAALFEYLTGWFFEIELWQVGTRGIVAEVGHYDKELPLQLMLVVGDLSTERPGSSNLSDRL